MRSNIDYMKNRWINIIEQIKMRIIRRKNKMKEENRIK